MSSPNRRKAAEVRSASRMKGTWLRTVAKLVETIVSYPSRAFDESDAVKSSKRAG